MKMNNTNKNPLSYENGFLFGGEKGIRTPERVLAVTRFPIVRLRPAQPSLRATVLLYLKLYKKSRVIFKKS